MSNNIANLTPPKGKPYSSLMNILSLLKPHSVPFVPRSKQFTLQQNKEELQVLLLMKGKIEIYTDACQILFANIEAPAIIGLQGSKLLYETYQFRIGRKSDDNIMSVLPLSNCTEILAKSDGLLAMLDYQRYIRDYQTYRNTILACRNNQEIVCALLTALAEIPLEQRMKISTANYIIERSSLARSGVMKTLATLKEEEYIRTEKGKLIKILKKFPT